MLLSILAVSVLSLSAYAVPAWREADLNSYVTGTQVTDNGNTYQCKPHPFGGWCKLKSYRPSSHHGNMAWTTIGSSQPSTTKVPVATTAPKLGKCEGTPPNPIPVWVPYSARPNDHHNGGDFVTHQGKIWQAQWWATTEPGTHHVWKLCGDATPPVVPETTQPVQTTQPPPKTTQPPPKTTQPPPETTQPPPETTQPPPAPTHRVLPPLGNCKGTPPNPIEVWVPYTPSKDHHVGGSFVTHRGKIWRAKWWATKEPGTNHVWELCGDAVVGTLKVAVSGGPASFTLKLNNNEYTVQSSGATIGLSAGEFTATVDKIILISEMRTYTATVNPGVINVTEKKDYNLSVTFTTGTIQLKPVTVQVTFPEGTPSPLPTATIAGEGYSESVELQAGSTTFNVPELGTYRVNPASYEAGEKTFSASQLTVTNGAVVGESSITYTAAVQVAGGRIFAGYMPVSWHKAVKVSEAAQKGYNVCIPAFITLSKDAPIKFTQNLWLAYTGWGGAADSPATAAAIKADIALAKANHGLKYVVASVGGQNNTFDPKGADVTVLARKLVDFFDTYGIDGLDFDLEGIPHGVTQEYIVDFIRALKVLKPDVIITCAPQVNNVSGKLAYVNHGVQQIYNASIAAGLYNYILVQEYNTGGNYVDRNGDLCSRGSPACYDQTSPGFIVNSFYALNKITPAQTLIVPGQPSVEKAGGNATVFHGPSAGDPYNAMAAAYGQLGAEAQFGGAMTWEISLDSAANYPFANSIAPAVFP